MGCKYVKEFDFGPAKTYVNGYCRGGSVKKMAEGGAVKADLKQDKAMIKAAVHKHEKAMHPGKPLTKLAKGGPVMEKATGERYPSRQVMMKHERMETPRMQRDELTQRAQVTQPAVRRKMVPVAPQAPLVAMKQGGYARKK